MLVEGTIVVINSNPFCLYKNREVGIASGYFAGDMFAAYDGDEYITKISGRSFGWYDINGDYHKDDKGHMSRPTVEQICSACIMSDALASIAIEMGLIDLEKKDVVESRFHFSSN
tara:strand:+ start:2746 stop:3090 length:345 start_codon:yes stop_codon:yes gene_type:complete